MRFSRKWVRAVLVVVAIAAASPLAYWLGYRAGYAAKLPRPWALAVVNSRTADGTANGMNYSWFDLNKPEDVARMQVEEAKLKASGADYYLAEGEYVSELRPKPDPQRTNAHR